MIALPLVVALCNLRWVDCRWVLAIGLGLLALRFIWVQSIWRLSGLLRRWRGKGDLTMVPTARSCWLLTVGGVRGAVTLAGVMSVPLLLAPGQDFPERDLPAKPGTSQLSTYLAAGVISPRQCHLLGHKVFLGDQSARSNMGVTS